MTRLTQTLANYVHYFGTVAVPQYTVTTYYAIFHRGAENAKLENATRETGKRENGLIMESRSSLYSRHTSRRYFKCYRIQANSPTD